MRDLNLIIKKKLEKKLSPLKNLNCKTYHFLSIFFDRLILYIPSRIVIYNVIINITI